MKTQDQLDNLYHAVSNLLTDIENLNGNYEAETLKKVKQAMADVWEKNEKRYVKENLKVFTNLEINEG